MNEDIYFPITLDDNVVNNNYFVFGHNRYTSTNSTVLVPLDGYHNPVKIKVILDATDDIIFKNLSDVLIWRGATTGRIHGTGRHCQNNRLEFIEQFKGIPSFDMGFTFSYQENYWGSNRSEIKRRVGALMKRSIPIGNILQSKCILCLEGNDWSTTFIYALASRGCAFHTYPFTAENILFGDIPTPWEHFVPVAVDGSDLIEKYGWCMANKVKCNEIADNGRRYIMPYLNSSLYNEVLKKMIDLFVHTKRSP
jgi:hypothetical protein